MTDTEKLELLKPAIQALLAEVHKLGNSRAEMNVQTQAAWVGEILGNGPHGIERTSIVETVEMTFDREQEAEAEREDADAAWRGPDFSNAKAARL